MDLEVLIKACWNRRLRILATMLVFGVVLVAGGTALKPLKYAATAQVAVYPDGADSSVLQVYAVSPNRYVATQIKVVESPNLISQVASQLHLPLAQVQKMVTVSQATDSDIINVKATYSSPTISAAVSKALAQNYTSAVTTAATRQFQSTQATLVKQIDQLSQQITGLQTQLSQPGISPAETTSVEGAVTTLLNERSSLTTQLGTVRSSNATPLTHVVSAGTPTVGRVGTSKTKLALYGLILGMLIGIARVALSVGPSRSLENLKAIPEIDQVPVIGVIDTRRKLASRLVSPFSRRHEPTVDEIRVAVELNFTLRLKEHVALIPVGKRQIARKSQLMADRLLDAKVPVKAPSSPALAANGTDSAYGRGDVDVLRAPDRALPASVSAAMTLADRQGHHEWDSVWAVDRRLEGHITRDGDGYAQAWLIQQTELIQETEELTARIEAALHRLTDGWEWTPSSDGRLNGHKSHDERAPLNGHGRHDQRPALNGNGAVRPPAFHNGHVVADRGAHPATEASRQGDGTSTRSVAPGPDETHAIDGPRRNGTTAGAACPAHESGGARTGQTTQGVVVVPLSTMLLEGGPESCYPVYLSVDIATVRPRDLVDVITTLRSTGADLTGIIGIR